MQNGAADRQLTGTLTGLLGVGADLSRSARIQRLRQLRRWRRRFGSEDGRRAGKRSIEIRATVWHAAGEVANATKGLLRWITRRALCSGRRPGGGGSYPGDLYDTLRGTRTSKRDKRWHGDPHVPTLLVGCFSSTGRRWGRSRRRRQAS
jgi:hypothetical protein